MKIYLFIGLCILKMIIYLLFNNKFVREADNHTIYTFLQVIFIVLSTYF